MLGHTVEEEKIESVTFYKQIYQSTQIFEKTITNNSLMAISLPRIKFLERDGEYRPSWAVDKDKPAPVLPTHAAYTQHRAYKKETHRKLMYKRGGYPVTGFEQIVHDMLKEGLTKEEICQKLNKKNLPILMITSKAEIAYVLEAVKAGVNNYIVKPWEEDEFVKKLIESDRN